MTVLNEKYPLIKLDRNITVVNFTSPHEYEFDTGEVLSACSNEVANTMKLSPDHSGIAHVVINGGEKNIAVPQSELDRWEKFVHIGWPDLDIEKMWLDISINYRINDEMLDDILSLTELDIVDIILVPYPVLNAFKQETEMHRKVVEQSDILSEDDGAVMFADNWENALNKMRTCNLVDRITKKIYSSRFCK